MLEELSNQDMVLGVFLAGLGIVFMLMGVRMFKGLLAISFGVIGFVLGGSLPGTDIARLSYGLIAAISLAMLSVALTRFALCLLAGGWAGLVALTMAARVGLSDQTCLILAGAAALVAVSLTFIMFYEMVAFTTSLEGALLFSGGLMVFLAQSPTVWVHIRGMLIENLIFGPFLILAGTFTGFYLQLTEIRRKDTGMVA